MTQKTSTNGHELTDEQKKIICTSKDMERGETILITACAGSGKTFTLTEVAKANPGKKFLYLAYNKSAATDAAKKFPGNVEVRTVHSAAYKAMVSNGPYKKRELKNIRVYDIMSVLKTDDIHAAKKMLEKYEEFLHSDDVNAKGTAEVIYEMVEDKKLPLTHDHYLKAFQIRNLSTKSFGKNYDFVLLDEAQDSNDVTMSLLVNSPARKIIVGDPNQQIYAFRGAINIMDKISASERLTLSTSFRCPDNVIRRSNAIIRKYKPESYVEMTATHKGGIEPVQGKRTAYLSRCNARLISCFDALIRAGQLGEIRFERDPEKIFMPALCVLDRMHGKQARSKEMSFLNSFSGIPEISEYAETANDVELIGAVSRAKEFGERLESLFDTAKKCYLSQENEPRTISLSTAHSSKGLEWENIIILEDFVPLAEIEQDMRLGKSTEQYLKEEANIYYVTCTRSLLNITDMTRNMNELRAEGAVTEYEMALNEKSVSCMLAGLHGKNKDKTEKNSAKEQDAGLPENTDRQEQLEKKIADMEKYQKYLEKKIEEMKKYQEELEKIIEEKNLDETLHGICSPGIKITAQKQARKTRPAGILRDACAMDRQPLTRTPG